MTDPNVCETVKFELSIIGKMGAGKTTLAQLMLESDVISEMKLIKEGNSPWPEDKDGIKREVYLVTATHKLPFSKIRIS